jgi:aryl-alcohol dehydrogenase-like predicted oxidoreductase
MEYAAGRGLRPPSVSSVHVTLAVPVSPVWGHKAATEGDLRWYAQVGMPVISWAPLAHGFFSDQPKPFGDSDENVRGWYASEENYERRARARACAGERGVTLAEIALAYVWHLPGQIVSIVGALNAEQVGSAYAAEYIRLSENEMKWLNLECGSR